MENKVILSADSTCDLGGELQARYHVNYIPYHISLDEHDYLDNVNINAEQIYQAYWDKRLLPKTSAINIAAVSYTHLDVYKRQIADRATSVQRNSYIYIGHDMLLSE